MDVGARTSLHAHAKLEHTFHSNIWFDLMFDRRDYTDYWVLLIDIIAQSERRVLNAYALMCRNSNMIATSYISLLFYFLFQLFRHFDKNWQKMCRKKKICWNSNFKRE